MGLDLQALYRQDKEVCRLSFKTASHSSWNLPLFGIYLLLQVNDSEPYNLKQAKKRQTSRKTGTQSYGSKQFEYCRMAGLPKLSKNWLDSLAQ